MATLRVVGWQALVGWVFAQRDINSLDFNVTLYFTPERFVGGPTVKEMSGGHLQEGAGKRSEPGRS